MAQKILKPEPCHEVFAPQTLIQPWRQKEVTLAAGTTVFHARQKRVEAGGELQHTTSTRGVLGGMVRKAWGGVGLSRLGSFAAAYPELGEDRCYSRAAPAPCSHEGAL